MKQKAVAYYKVAYQQASQSPDRILSFPWVDWDILTQVRRDRFHEMSDEEASCVITEESPFYLRLLGLVGDVDKDLKPECIRFFEEHVRPYRVLLAHCHNNRGLYIALFVLHRWAERNGVFSNSFRPTHLVVLVIMCGRGEVPESRHILNDVTTEGADSESRELNVPKFIMAFLQVQVWLLIKIENVDRYYDES